MGFSAGPHFTSPDFTSHCDPCQGHWTVPQISFNIPCLAARDFAELSGGTLSA